MKGFGRRKETDHLERRLRDDRPVPPQELLNEVVTRIEPSRVPSSTRTARRRLGLAGLAAAVMLAVFAAFGGAGLAASGVSDATSSTVDAVVTLVKPEKNPTRGAALTASGAASGSAGRTLTRRGDDCDDDSVSAAREEYCSPRITICHRGRRTLSLPIRAAQRHLRNHPRDYPGPCQRDEDED